MARKTKTANLARRILAINTKTRGRMLRLIEAIETLSDCKKEWEEMDARCDSMCDRNDRLNLTAAQRDAADAAEKKMFKLVDCCEEEMSEASDAVQTAADDLVFAL
jgi:hypothetical protein